MGKKGLLFAVLAFGVAVFFASCKDEEPLTGSVDLTIGQKAYRMTQAEYSFVGEDVVVFASNPSQSIDMYFQNKGVNKYSIGYGADTATMWNNIANLEAFHPDATVRFRSSLESGEELVAVRGEMRISEFGSDSIVGWFSAKGLTPEQDSLLVLGGYSKDSLEKILKPFSAKFVCVPQK